VQQRPEYAGRYRKVGSYFAVRILVADLRRGNIAALAANLRRFRSAGLIQDGLGQMFRDYRAVRTHRRTFNNSPVLATLAGPPSDLL
jgi:hypothetical protein